MLVRRPETVTLRLTSMSGESQMLKNKPIRGNRNAGRGPIDRAAGLFLRSSYEGRCSASAGVNVVIAIACTPLANSCDKAA